MRYPFSPPKILASLIVSIAQLGLGLTLTSCAEQKAILHSDLPREVSPQKANPEPPSDALSELSPTSLKTPAPERQREPSLRDLCDSNEVAISELHQAWEKEFQRADAPPKDLWPCLKKLCSFPESDVRCLQAQAKILIAMENFEGASQMASSILAKSPEDSTAFALLALASLGLRHLGEAFLFAHRAVQLNGNSPEANYALALALASDGTLENDGEAASLLKGTLQKSPEFLSAWKALGQLALRHRDFLLAEKAFQRVATLEGESAWCDLHLAWSIEAQTTEKGESRAIEAVEFYERAVSHDETRIDATLGLAELNSGILKAPEKAIFLFTSALSLMSPEDPRRANAEASLKKAQEKAAVARALQSAAREGSGDAL